jgi:hypothetical protein
LILFSSEKVDELSNFKFLTSTFVTGYNKLAYFVIDILKIPTTKKYSRKINR